MSRYLSQFPITSGYRPANRPSHVGVDIGCPAGTPIPSLVDGSVVFEGLIKAPVAGYRDEIICIVQSSGYFIVYGHLSATVVDSGQKVKKGQIIGRSGNTGYVLPKPKNNQDLVSGAHLHIERRQGTKAASQPLSAYSPQDITPQINNYGAAQGGGQDMTQEEAFRYCYITQVGDWPKKAEIDAWKKSGLAAYTWVQQHAPNPSKQALVDYRTQAEKELSELSKKEIAARVDLENAERTFRQERSEWAQEKSSLVDAHNEEILVVKGKLSVAEQENTACNKHLEKAQQNAKDVARWTWQEHLTAAFSKLFSRGGES